MKKEEKKAQNPPANPDDAALVITDQKQAQDFVAWCIKKKEEAKRNKKQEGQHG